MTNGQPVKIPLRSEKSTKIFSYSDRFMPELNNYKLTGAKRPSVELHLLCGQEVESLAIDSSVLIRITVTVQSAVNNLKIADNMVGHVHCSFIQLACRPTGY